MLPLPVLEPAAKNSPTCPLRLRFSATQRAVPATWICTSTVSLRTLQKTRRRSDLLPPLERPFGNTRWQEERYFVRLLPQGSSDLGFKSNAMEQLSASAE